MPGAGMCSRHRRRHSAVGVVCAEQQPGKATEGEKSRRKQRTRRATAPLLPPFISSQFVRARPTRAGGTRTRAGGQSSSGSPTGTGASSTRCAWRRRRIGTPSARARPSRRGPRASHEGEEERDRRNKQEPAAPARLLFLPRSPAPAGRSESTRKKKNFLRRLGCCCWREPLSPALLRPPPLHRLLSSCGTPTSRRSAGARPTPSPRRSCRRARGCSRPCATRCTWTALLCSWGTCAVLLAAAACNAASAALLNPASFWLRAVAPHFSSS